VRESLLLLAARGLVERLPAVDARDDLQRQLGVLQRERSVPDAVRGAVRAASVRRPVRAAAPGRGAVRAAGRAPRRGRAPGDPVRAPARRPAPAPAAARRPGAASGLDGPAGAPARLRDGPSGAEAARASAAASAAEGRGAQVMRRVALLSVAVVAALSLVGCRGGPRGGCCPDDVECDGCMVPCTPDAPAHPVVTVRHNDHPMPGTSVWAVPGPIVHR
jgi:hypothetical protein